MNPYQVLGVSENASDDEVKSAYRALVKKYHPDRYVHGSAEQAAAAEKLKQINAAYDMITKGGRGSFNWNTSSSSQWSGTSQFADIRAAIQRGEIGRADTMLDQMSEHPAEWHYLKGIVLLRRGWYDGAAQEFRRAYQMEPGNGEYERAMRAMTQSAASYQDYGDQQMQTQFFGSTACRACATCACLSLCGSGYCCGGGMPLIFCC